MLNTVEVSLLHIAFLCFCSLLVDSAIIGTIWTMFMQHATCTHLITQLHATRSGLHPFPASPWRSLGTSALQCTYMYIVMLMLSGKGPKYTTICDVDETVACDCHVFLS